MPTTISTTPTEFKIINTSYVVEPWSPDRPEQPALLGALADVPGHGRLARWEVRGRAGPVYGFRKIDPDNPSKAGETLRVPLDECGRLLNDLTASGAGATRLRRLVTTVREQEFQRFEKEWPAVSEALGLASKKVVSLIDPGDIYVPAEYDYINAGDVDWRSYVDRLVTGDFGIVGQYNADVDMSIGACWAHDLADRLTRNNRVVAGRSGYLLAAYPVTSSRRPGSLVLMARCIVGQVTAMTIREADHLPIE